MIWSEVPGNKYFIVSDEGYKIAVYICDGVAQFRASSGGEFIAPPRPSQQHAMIDCNDHYELALKTPN